MVGGMLCKSDKPSIIIKGFHTVVTALLLVHCCYVTVILCTHPSKNNDNILQQ